MDGCVNIVWAKRTYTIAENCVKQVLVLDSGVGGLNVLRGLQRLCPQVDYLYFADGEYFPYGNKSKAEVRERVRKILDTFADSVGLCVLACNTASSVFDDGCRALFDFPVVDVIAPTVAKASLLTNTKHVTVLSTELTAQCGVYVGAFAERGITAHSVACPNLVTLAESFVEPTSATDEIADALADVKRTDSDVVVLGCTHFDWFAEQIQAVVGQDCHVVSSSLCAAEYCQALLEKQSFSPSHQGWTTYLTSSKKHTVSCFCGHDMLFRSFYI